MAFLVYQRTGYETQHEMNQYFVLCKKMKEYYGNREELCVFISNYSINGCELDGLIIKPDGICIVEFKSGGGTIVAKENGDWMCNGRIIKGGASGKTVLGQLRTNKSKVGEKLRSLNIIANSSIIDIGAIVVFDSSVEVDNQIEGPINLWLRIGDNNSFVEQLRTVKGRKMYLDTDAIKSIISQLGLTNSDLDNDYCMKNEELVAVHIDPIIELANKENQHQIEISNINKELLRLEKEKQLAIAEKNAAQAEAEKVQKELAAIEAKNKELEKTKLTTQLCIDCNDRDYIKNSNDNAILENPVMPRPGQIIQMGVHCYTDRTPEYYKLCALVQKSIDAKGGIIYNGSQEYEEVPFYCNILQVFYNFDPEDEEYLGCSFPGWHDFAKVTAVHFERVAAEQREEILRSIFVSSTVDMWLVYRDQFDNNDTLAVRTELTNGQWFETIMNNCNKKNENATTEKLSVQNEETEQEINLEDLSDDNGDKFEEEARFEGLTLSEYQKKYILKLIPLVEEKLSIKQISKRLGWKVTTVCKRLAVMISNNLDSLFSFLELKDILDIKYAIRTSIIGADYKEIKKKCYYKQDNANIELVYATLFESDIDISPIFDYGCYYWHFVKNVKLRGYSKSFFNRTIKIGMNSKGYFIHDLNSGSFIKIAEPISHMDTKLGSILVYSPQGKYPAGKLLYHNINGEKELIGWIREEEKRIVFTELSGVERYFTW